MIETKNRNEKARFSVVLLLTGLVLAGLFIFSFAELAEEVLEKEVKGFDQAVIQWFQSFESSGFTSMMVFITELGSVWFLTVFSAVILLALWFKYRDKWGMLFFLLAIAGGGAMTWLLKHFYQRSRPSINPEIDAIGFSFPSGHSMGSLIFYGFLVYLIVRSHLPKTVKRIVLVAAPVLILLIGSSRVYLGAHFPSDVIAGYLAGTIWLILCLLSLEWTSWHNRADRSAVRPVHAMRKWLSIGWNRLRQFRKTG